MNLKLVELNIKKFCVYALREGNVVDLQLITLLWYGVPTR